VESVTHTRSLAWVSFFSSYCVWIKVLYSVDEKPSPGTVEQVAMQSSKPRIGLTDDESAMSPAQYQLFRLIPRSAYHILRLYRYKQTID